MAGPSRKRPWSLIIIVVVAVAFLSYTIFTDNRPFLGLDLQGGVSVVLAPPAGVHPSSDSLDEAITIINNRINSFGVSEAQVSRQGDEILVEIPGVKDKDRALKLVGETAELQFRPVLQIVPVSNGEVQVQASPSTTAGATATTAAGSASPSTSSAAATTSTTAAATTTTKPATSTSQKSLGVTGTGEQAGGLAAPPATVTDLAAASTTTTAAATTTTAKGATTTTAKGATTTTAKTTSIKASTIITPDSELAKTSSRAQTVWLPSYDPKSGQMTALYQLGPTYLTGSGLSTASSDLNQQGQWEVRPVFKSGAKGIDLFNKGAQECYSGATTCPVLDQTSGRGQMAIVLDNRVLTAPSIDQPSFSSDGITISGTFTESQVHDIATALKYGALPVPLKAQTSEIVSATLGRDALHAGLVAGIVGFILVGLYMLVFYRILGLLAMFKLLIEGCILWGFLCWAGGGLGLAITLAGITGIVVSIGVSLDSNVVYYEHLKEDVRAGRTIRASVDKSFTSAWRTIVAADMASVIGAAILYWFTVGAVRGFAFYLGLATALDLLTSWCYMRPAVARATRSAMCVTNPHRFGLPDADDVEEASHQVRKLVTEGAS